jgi:hypothetical protein
MTTLDWYGIGALSLIVVVFYFVRKIPAYLAAAGAIVVGFVAVTCQSVDWPQASDWLVMTLGLLACIFGLLIVRVMLIRSVSLNLLRSIEGATADRFGEDIGARLGDMRSFHLIETAEGRNSLTPFGRLVSGVVAAFYAILRIQA